MKSLLVISLLTLGNVSASDYFITCNEVSEEYSESYHSAQIKERSGKLIMKVDYYDDDDYGYSAPMSFDYVSFSSIYNGKVESYKNENSQLRIYLTREVSRNHYEASLSFEDLGLKDMKMICNIK